MQRFSIGIDERDAGDVAVGEADTVVENVVERRRQVERAIDLLDRLVEGVDAPALDGLDFSRSLLEVSIEQSTQERDDEGGGDLKAGPNKARLAFSHLRI